MGAKRTAYRYLVAKPEEKRPLATLRGRWENRFKVVLRRIKFGAWPEFVGFRIGLRVRIFVNKETNLPPPDNSRDFFGG
jgi:hypothetical protein